MVYLDSADLSDARTAAELGFVSGITTNPSLLARDAVGEPLEHLRALRDAFPGTILYQPTRSDPVEAEQEARQAYLLGEGRVAIKLLANTRMFALGARLSREGTRCAATAVYSSSQALLAHSAGFRWVIPYVDRASRLAPDGASIVTRLRSVLQTLDSETGILAASLKSPAQVEQALSEGAADVTVPLDVLLALAEDPLTESAAADFDQDVRARWHSADGT